MDWLVEKNNPPINSKKINKGFPHIKSVQNTIFFYIKRIITF